MARKYQADVLIIGGGIAGCIAAITLSEHYRVLLIEKNQQPQQRIGESLAPAAVRILKKLKIWDEFPEQVSRKNIGMQSYWGSNHCNIVDHMANPDGCVLNLNRQSFEAYLRKKTEDEGVDCMWGSKFSICQFDQNEWQVTVDNGDAKQHINTPFIIDATGRQSHFLRKQGVKRHYIDKLIACWMTLPNNQENTMSVITADESGWWYSAVLPDNNRVMAFHTDSDLIESRFKDDKEAFIVLAENNQVMSNYIDYQKNICMYHGMVAANSTCAQQVAGPAWAAIGDAAISFDPLSSQGMFNAMASAVQLADLVKNYDMPNNRYTKDKQIFQTNYTEQINRIWLHYLNHKDLFYRQEMRWKSKPFWQRRH